jgi:hypothetical protein
MKQELRKQELAKKADSDDCGPIDPFSEESVRRAFEQEKQSSERRFDAIASTDAFRAISKATREFKSRQDLEVFVCKTLTGYTGTSSSRVIQI